MREIKFRAWMIAGKYMKSWEDLEHMNFWAYANHGGIWELMQYTGLKDKNGKEIYEGDIVIHHYFHETGTVIWQQSQSRYALEYLSDKKTQELFPIDTAMFEIIGNIYENPELLNRHC
jgi:hypothetical protein